MIERFLGHPKRLLLIYLSFFSIKTYSQNIQGSVVSNKGTPLNASILFKERLKPETAKEFTIVKGGKFYKKIHQTYKKLLIEVTAEGYYSQTRTLENLKKDSTYSYNFVLDKIKEYELKEVIIVSNKKHFEIKEDTVSFNVSRYKDGSERKIEEVIKKLPGIDLNQQTGEIKYHGKSIETVTLDGDNLFGLNYTLGTKNINVDVVEQIEAIDNYTKNPLLKGIEQGGKVSLNLKLKNSVLDLSGNLDFGIGWFKGRNKALDLNSNVLGITKTYKSFATLAYNNVGVNHAPFDYFGNEFTLEQLKEQEYYAEKVIPETLFTNLLENRRANINNQYFGNYNAVFKVNPKLRIKANLYYLKDKITSNQVFQNNFEIKNTRFTTSDDTFIAKEPQYYRSDLDVKYNASNSSLLEYSLRLKQENIEVPTTVVQNKTDTFSSFLKTKDFFLKQNLLWTKKLSKRKALQVSLFYSYNNLPQSYRITPSLFNEKTENEVQKSGFKKSYVEGKADYLGANKRDKYAFTIGASLNHVPYSSRLYNDESTLFENRFDYRQSDFFNAGVYNFNRGDWQVSPSYSLRFLSQSLVQKAEIQKTHQNNFVFEPALKIKYAIDFVSFLIADVGYYQNINAGQYFFLNQVLINSRTSIKNSPNLKLQANEHYRLSYFNNNLYNQFELYIRLGYQKSTGNFFANQKITENITQIEYFFLPQDKSDWSINLQASKYIPFLQSTLRLTTNHSISDFRNIVNNSELRLNRNQYLINSVFWKTAFESPFNFENTFALQHSNSKSKDQSAFINTSWQNNFKILIKPNNKWFLIMSSDYFLPNKNLPDKMFFFLDASFRHRPKSKIWEASIEIRNLTNEENFEQIQTSDISTSIFKSNLLKQLFLLKVNWNF